MPLVIILFCVTLTNCDSDVYSHFPYKPLQDCDYRQKKILQNSQLFNFFTWLILNTIMHY
jgi:hypothetical protein